MTLRLSLAACLALFIGQTMNGQEIAGTFSISTTTIMNFIGDRDATKNLSTDPNPPNSVQLDSTEIYVVEGAIRKIYVYIGDSVFTNSSTHIPLSRFPNRQGDILVNNENIKSYIYVGNVLRYRPHGADALVPDDIYVKLIPNKINSKNIFRSSILCVDLRAFSDMLGVFNEEPNGLVQFEGNFKIHLFISNIWRNKPVFAIQYIQPYFTTARFDRDFGFTEIRADSTIDRMSLFQRSSFIFGIDLNLAKFYSRSGHRIELKAGYQYNRSDILQPSDSTRIGASMNAFTLSLPISLKAASSIEFSYTPTIFIQEPEYESTTSYIKNFGQNDILRHQFGLFFNLSKDDALTRVFVRFSKFDNLLTKGNNFTQLQVGFERSLDDLFKSL